MGLLDLTQAEWKSVEDLISETDDLLKIENKPSLSNQKKCSI